MRTPRLLHSDAGQGATEQRTEPYLSTAEGAAEVATQAGAESDSRAASLAGRQAGAVEWPWQLFDTHCHIHEAQFELPGDEAMRAIWLRANKPDPDDIIQRAVKEGVTRMICVGTSAADSQLAVDFVQSRRQCWASVGLHPHEAKNGDQALQTIAKLADQPKVVAIGECGLDYYYTHSPKADQQKALRFQIELAQKHNVPLIFHVREAFDDFWPIFDSYLGLHGVLHSFTDTQANLDKALARGLYIGVNGIITFTKHDWQLEVAKNIPADRLLLETDAPFLTPAPLRGKVNEPAYVRLVAEFLSKLRNQPLDEIAAASTHNATKLFSL